MTALSVSSVAVVTTMTHRLKSVSSAPVLCPSTPTSIVIRIIILIIIIANIIDQFTHFMY